MATRVELWRDGVSFSRIFLLVGAGDLLRARVEGAMRTVPYTRAVGRLQPAG